LKKRAGGGEKRLPLQNENPVWVLHDAARTGGVTSHFDFFWNCGCWEWEYLFSNLSFVWKICRLVAIRAMGEL